MMPSDPYLQLVYWCDCQAATLMEMCLRKRTSQTAFERQRNITRGMIATTQTLLVGNDTLGTESKMLQVEARFNRALVAWDARKVAK